jgi:hypothetical protein
MIISARTESSTACWTCASVSATPPSAALALILSPIALARGGPLAVEARRSARRWAPAASRGGPSSVRGGLARRRLRPRGSEERRPSSASTLPGPRRSGRRAGSTKAAFGPGGRRRSGRRRSGSARSSLPDGGVPLPECWPCPAAASASPPAVGRPAVRPQPSHRLQHRLAEAAGLSATVMPADFIASILSSAPPLPPATMAPAWPMRRPGGAVRPAMKPATGLERPRRASSLRNWPRPPRPRRRSRRS